MDTNHDPSAALQPDEIEEINNSYPFLKKIEFGTKLAAIPTPQITKEERDLLNNITPLFDEFQAGDILFKRSCEEIHSPEDIDRFNRMSPVFEKYKVGQRLLNLCDDDNYSDSGTDGDLNSPDPNSVTPQNFIPITWSGGSTYLQVGSKRWASNGNAGTTSTWGGWGFTASNPYGAITLVSSGGPFIAFAPESDNGLKTFNFAGAEGSFKYFYHAAAWTKAFNGVTGTIVISQAGSVYKDSIQASNLVVSFDGIVGSAGE